MPIHVKLPDSLARFCDGQRTVAARGPTLAAALRELTSRHPELQPRLFGRDGELASHLMLLHNGRTVARTSLAEHTIADDETVEIVFLAGGG